MAGPMRLDQQPSSDGMRRAKLIKAAGKGMENPVLHGIVEHAGSGTVVGYVEEAAPKRRVIHLPNPINYAKWALKIHNRRKAEAAAEGLPEPEWGFPVSVAELSRRVIVQRKGTLAARLRVAKAQVVLLEKDELVASKSKEYKAYLPAPIVRTGSCSPRTDAIAILELTKLVGK